MDSPIVTPRVRRLARILWDYHCLETALDQADFILALGSHDERVAERSAELFNQGFAPWLVVSGGHGKVTGELWGQTEAERFAGIAISRGVHPGAVLVEDRATNTGDNIRFARVLLLKHGVLHRRGIIVTKPYMRRRAYATARKQWPTVRWQVSSPETDFDAYPSADVPEARMVELMVGDLQRIGLYAKKGLQIRQPIPRNVKASFDELVALGFTRYLMGES